MNVNELQKLYSDEERECWQCTDYIKHNPVLYPRVGDLFLKELFTLANPERKIPYNRRKKVQMNSVWYRITQTSYASYVIGCEIYKLLLGDMDIRLNNGKQIPFYAYWYLLCLFLGEADKLSKKELSAEAVVRLKKEKEQKGICKSDCRRYYKCIGLTLEQAASDFPLTKNFCPMEREYDCNLDCPKQITVGEGKVCRGSFNFRDKEELLYFYATQKQVLPKGVLAGELLYRFLTEEYKAFGELLSSETAVNQCINEEEFNCQLFAIFAYLADCLSSFSWMKLYISQERNKELWSSELKKEGLWQLVEKVKQTTWSKESPILCVLTLAEFLNPMEIGLEPDIYDLIQFDFDSEKKKIAVNIPEKISKRNLVLEYQQSLERVNHIVGQPLIVIQHT